MGLLFTWLNCCYRSVAEEEDPKEFMFNAPDADSVSSLC